MSLPPSASRATFSSSSYREPFRKNLLYRQARLPVLVGSEPSANVVSLAKYQEDTRDWRKLQPQEIRQQFTSLLGSVTRMDCRPARLASAHEKADVSHQCEGLMTAIALGTMQAQSHGSYWASPDTPGLEPQSQCAPEITVSADCDPLDACTELASHGGPSRIALVRFTAAGDPQQTQPILSNFREAQLFVRTTYLHALAEMTKHTHEDVGRALAGGGLIHTTDVSILRGSVEEGAPWLAEAPQVDVLWVSLRRSPQHDENGQRYAHIVDRNHTRAALESIFRCAAMRGVEVLVLPAPGSGGTQHCYHPARDVGALLRETLLLHGKFVPRVQICRDFEGQPFGHWWKSFESALEGPKARETDQREALVMSMHLRKGWEEAAHPRAPGWLRRLGQFPPPIARCQNRAQIGRAHV